MKPEKKSARPHVTEQIGLLDPNRPSAPPNGQEPDAPKTRQRSPGLVAARALGLATDELTRIKNRITKLRHELNALETAETDARAEYDAALANITEL